MKKNILAQLSTLAYAFLFQACSQSGPSNQATTRAADTSKSDSQVNLFIWSGYVTDAQLEAFKKETGISVQVSNFSSNEELLAKLQAGATDYDVIVPSDYMVVALTKLNLLKALDKSKLPNGSSLDERVTRRYYDPKNEYSLPFSWGTTGIARNTKMYATPILGWKDLLTNKGLSGKFTLLDDQRESLGAALKSEAKSLNTTSDTELAAAKNRLLDAKSRVKGFNSDPLQGLVNGEMAVAQAYSCDALQAKQKNPAIEYILPKEGFTMWIDNLAIPAKAPHPEAALKLLNYLLSAKVEAERAKTLFTAPSNPAALTLLPVEIKENKSLFPDKATLARAEMIEDVGSNLPKFDRIWTEIKAQQ